ncbi:MAG: transcription elongation factor GreA [Patescibacteria group bacterium]
MRIPKRKAEEQANQNKKTDYLISADKLIKMKAEIKDLVERQRPQTIEQMQLAATDGDFSENAPYQDAKYRLRRINSRITSIEDKIKNAVIITKDDSGKIQVGSFVTIQCDGKEQTFEIVGSQESNPLRGKISYTSPLGSGMIGKVVGDVVVITSPDGEREYKVVGVE